MPHEVPPLGYAFDALEPHIDAKTMEIHHDKHHAAYVTNLNKALEAQPDLQKKSVEELLRGIERGAGGDPHRGAQPRRRPRTTTRLFWEVMGPGGGGKPTRRPRPRRSTGAFGGFDGVQGEADRRRPPASSARAGAGWWSRRQASSRSSTAPTRTAR